jgi:ribose transport system permease protein
MTTHTEKTTPISDLTMSDPPLRRSLLPSPRVNSRIGRVAALGARFAENYSLLLLLVAVIVFFSVYGPTRFTFLTQQNFEVTVASQAVLSIVAIALLIPLICGGFDLSVGATTGLSAVFVASALSEGVAVPQALGLGLGIGLAVGMVNAVLVARLELDAVIATLGTATLAGGVVIQKTGGASIVANIPKSVSDFGTGSLWLLPNALVVLIVIAGVTWFILEHTSAGRQIYALGSNPQAAHLVGLRTKGVLGGTFVLAGGLAGLAGALMVARSGGADPFAGANLLLPAFAAAFLSAATVKPGKFNVGGLLIAVFFLAALNSGLNLAGAPPYMSHYVNGGALVVGVTLAAFLYRRRLRG